nr:MAG TPA: hypothetical protein [Caudoviricetes sp.]
MRRDSLHPSPRGFEVSREAQETVCCPLHENFSPRR